MGYTYARATKPYEPLASETRRVSGALMVRANAICELVLGGNPETGLQPDLRVLPEAKRLIETEGKHSVASKRLDALALLNTATFIVAEQEFERGKPLRDEQLGDLMLAAMKELTQSKHQLKEHMRKKKRDVSTSKHELER